MKCRALNGENGTSICSTYFHSQKKINSLVRVKVGCILLKVSLRYIWQHKIGKLNCKLNMWFMYYKISVTYGV